MTDITLMAPRTLSIFQVGISQEYRDQMVYEVYKFVGPNNYVTNVKAKATSYFLHEQSNIFDNLVKRLSELKKESKWLSALQKSFKENFILDNFWGAVYSKGDYTVKHHHLDSLFSFVYFLKIGATNTPLVFDELNYSHIPVEDQIIFFPADVLHHVPAHMHDEDRIILAGNVALEHDLNKKEMKYD